MAKAEWGAKHGCPKCGTRFYDLGKDDPVSCIECGYAWHPDPVLKSKQPIPYEEVKKVEVVEDTDLADPDSSVFVIATGQSGHPLSRHYDDMAELWRRGEYVGMSLDPELARAAATGITHLQPLAQ